MSRRRVIFVVDCPTLLRSDSFQGSFCTIIVPIAYNNRMASAAIANQLRSSKTIMCCWGGIELVDLVKVAPKQSVVLLDGEDYIALNKPPDLRLDGDHPATVYKILEYWYPGVIFRHTHQLDYATSGIQLFAKSKVAARDACAAFANRIVKKAYTATVHGRFEPKLEWPVWSREKLQTAITQVESRYKNKQKDTKWLGYQPPHSLFQVWRAQQRKGWKNTKLVNEEQWEEVWGPLGLLTEPDMTILKTTDSWRDLKKERNIIKAFKSASDIYNRIVGPDSHPLIDIPRFMSLKDEPKSFAIFMHISEGGEFQMNVGFDNPNVPVNVNADGKPCLTIVEVLDASDSSTTFRMEPWTGRRHQLRVHCAASGHPIMGDVTYGSNDTVKRLHLHSTKLKIPGIVDLECYDPGFGMTIPSPAQHERPSDDTCPRDG